MKTMDSLGPTNTDLQLWKQLEAKVGYISFFGHFYDNPFAATPRTKVQPGPFVKVGGEKNGGEVAGVATEVALKEGVDEKAPEEVVAENSLKLATPEVVVEVVSQDAVAEKTPEESIPETVAHKEVSHKNGAAESVPEEVVEAVTENAVSDNIPKNIVAEEIVSKELAAEEVAVKEVASETVLTPEKKVLSRDAWAAAGLSKEDVDKELCFETLSGETQAARQQSIADFEAAEDNVYEETYSGSLGEKHDMPQQLLLNFENDGAVSGDVGREIMASDKEAANELPASFMTDASPSIADHSTIADSSQFLTDDSWLPETPITANTSMVDDDKTSAERRASNEAGYELSADTDDYHGDDDLELPPLPRDDGNDIAFPKPHHPSSSPLAPGSSDAEGPSSGSKKRCRSLSPTRDAPYAVEHEGLAMSGKSPGAKRRRLQKDDSSPDDDAPLELSRAVSKASTKKRVLDLEDSLDSFDDEDEVISAKRVKISPRDEKVAGREPPTNTTNAPKPRIEWSASKRYHSSLNNSIPDYGYAPHQASASWFADALPSPLAAASENTTPPQKSESMRGRHGTQGSFRPVNRLSSNESKAPAAATRPTPMKAYDFYGESYRRPDHSISRVSRPEGGSRGNATLREEIEDSPPSLRSSRHWASAHRAGSDHDQPPARGIFGTATSPRERDRGRDAQQISTLASQDARTSKNEKFMKHLKVKGQPSRSGASSSLRTTKQPINVEDLTKSDGSSVLTPQVLIKGLPGSSFESPVKKTSAHTRGRVAAEVIESEESMDDLSVGHYKKATEAATEKRKRFANPSVENESGLVNVIQDRLSAPSKRRRAPESSEKPKEAVDAETIHDSSDEEIHLLEKSNIKPTSFGASEKAAAKQPVSKKTAPKEKGPVKNTYKLLQLFSSSHPWFLGDRKQEWALVFNISNGVLDIEGKDALPMSMAIGSISLIEYSEQCAMMTIHKSRDNSFGGSQQVHITLTDIGLSDKLVSDITKKTPTIKSTCKNKDYMQNVFAQSRKLGVKNEKTREALKREQATVPQATRKFSSVVESKEPVTRSRRLIDNFDGPDLSAITKETFKAPSLPAKKAPLVQTVFDLTGDEDDTKSATPGSDSNSHSARSSARLKEGLDTSRRGSFDGAAWTNLHPEWRNNWKNPIIYPPTGRDRATINPEEIERLNEGEYLNDNLMLFYMHWLWDQAEKSHPEACKRVHIMSTFFYGRLTTNQDGKRRFNYEAVERWTSKLDLLSYDYVVVPVCENNHWYLAIICNVQRFLGDDHTDETAPQSQDGAQMRSPRIGRGPAAASSDPIQTSSQGAISVSSSTTSPTKKGKKKAQAPPGRNMDLNAPRIITLDSLGSRHSPTCTSLKEYMVAEIKAKRGIEIKPPGAIGMTATNIPQQDNGSDCGLFLLNYLEKFLEAPDEFIQNIVQNTPKFLENDLPSAPDTRAKIRKLLFELQAEQISAQISQMFDEPKQSIEGTGAASGDSNAIRPSTSGSQSPQQDATTSNSPGHAVPQPSREQSVTTPSGSSTDRGSRLGSLGAGQGAGSIIDEPVAPILKSTRERQLTPFSKRPAENDDDSEGDEMLLGGSHRASPQLLSDQSFSSLSSTLSGGSKPKSPKGSKPAGAPSYALDAADSAFISKGPKRLKKH